MTYYIKPYLSTLSIASVLLLSACGGGGGSGSSGGGGATIDTTPPTIAFSPSTLTVASEETASSVINTSGGLASTLAVSCTNDGAYDTGTNLFTAPVVAANTTSVCTATIDDAAGNTGTARLTATMTPPPPPDTTAPVITFTPATLTVASGSTATATLTVTDAGGVSATPTASCTNNGSYNVTTGVFTPADVTANTTSVCTITVADDAGNEGTGTLTVTMTPEPVATTVTVSGKLTYDRVPFSTSGEGLDYAATFELPIRQAPVELVSATGAVLESTVSDDNGDYSFTVLSGENVRVRVRSEVQKGAPNEIDLKIVDNTSSFALYALQGALEVVPASNQTRDLNAGSGWGSTSYTSTRAAAPFALLDTIYGTLEDFIEVDSEIDFPKFEVLWSTRNRSERGVVENGQITTSSFTVDPRGVPVIRILGNDGNDTDEYDVHVVVHEFGHYFENQLSRSDSIGGSHSSNDRLDARVAFGEGWGNALSAMILNDSVYRDSGRAAQGSDFVNQDIENNSFPGSTGWYSEGSVQSILYDLYDTADDGADEASYGLGPIYGAFVDPAYKDTQAFTTIFAFLEALGNQSGVTASEVTALTDAQLISGAGQFGTGETNDGGIADILPVYLPVPTNGTQVNFCSVDNFGEYNKHGNMRFLRVDIPTAGNYLFSMNQTTTGSGNPNFEVFKDGVFVGSGRGTINRLENRTINLQAGTHVLAAYAEENIQGGAGTGDKCYTFTVEAQ